MFVIVGLGNPGNEYKTTRHNSGRILATLLAEKLEFPEFRNDTKANGEAAVGVIDSKKVTILLPNTFMNKSGNAVSRYVKSVKAAKELMVVHDDIDLPFGTLRVSFGRGDGGHNGVASVMRALKTKDFIRVRVGVSPKNAKGVAKKPSGEAHVLKFLLGKFTPAEQKELSGKLFKRFAELAETAVSEGYVTAMNRFN